MTPLDWAVLLAGIAAIAWVNWYFFLSTPRERRGEASSGSGAAS